jgi:hypothetical protein
MRIARMHKQILRSEFACFNVAVLKTATNATDNSNTTDITQFNATAAADYANGFSTIAPPSTAATEGRQCHRHRHHHR